YDNPADGPDGWPLRKQELAAYVFDGSHSIIVANVIREHMDWLGRQFNLHHERKYASEKESHLHCQ
ncbi:MAG: hypothetical protein ACKO6L_09245, partial [Flavobacteriales bacterium]